MPTPKFDSSKPFTVVGGQDFDPEQPFTAEPTIGPPTGREPDLTVPEQINATDRASAAEGVTVGDVMSDPGEAFAKMGAILKRDLTDPSTWLAAAALYFGPKVLPKIAPAIRGAVNTASRVRVNPGAVMDLKINQPLQWMKKGLTLAPRPAAKGASPGVAQSAPAAAGDVPVAAVPSGPLAEPIATPASTSPAGGSVRPKSPQQILNEEALAARRAAIVKPVSVAAKELQTALTEAASKPKLTAPEMVAGLDMVRRGMTPEKALESIVQQRELAKMLGLKSPTSAETRFPKGMRDMGAPFKR